MKKTLMLFITIFVASFALTNCSSKHKEEYALELINDYMFKTLYYYDDYQPIETKIDSAIHTPFNDTTIMRYASIIIELRGQADVYQEQFDRAKEVFNTFGNEGTRNHRDPFREMMNATDDLISVLGQSAKYDDSIRLVGRQISLDFIGWAVTHKYKFKSKGGTLMTASKVFIMDEDFTKIVNVFDVEDDDYIKCQQIIKEILERK